MIYHFTIIRFTWWVHEWLMHNDKLNITDCTEWYEELMMAGGLVDWYNDLWSHDHRCSSIKIGQDLMIKEKFMKTGVCE